MRELWHKSGMQLIVLECDSNHFSGLRVDVISYKTGLLLQVGLVRVL